MKQHFFPFIGECLKAVFDHAESGLDMVYTPPITQRVSQAMPFAWYKSYPLLRMSEVLIRMLVRRYDSSTTPSRASIWCFSAYE